MNESEKNIIELIESALEVEKGILTEESALGSVESWDSLGHLSILAELDKHFDGKVAGINEMAEADSIKKILELLKNNSLV